MGFLSKLPIIKWGTVEFQVKFYIRNYAKLLRSGMSINDAINWLMQFYLKGEPYDRKTFMESKVNDYVNNVDDLIYDIMMFYFHYDSNNPTEDVISDTQHYLQKYKKIYDIS